MSAAIPAMAVRHVSTVVAAAMLITLGQLATPAPAAADKFNMGSGPVHATKAAARRVLDAKPNCGLTINKLTALMLSIPMHELIGGDRHLTPSPMTLSRWDSWSNPNNRPLFSDGTYAGYPRAHWNPGVGLWQLDTWAPTLYMEHWRRIQPHAGGRKVAEYLRQGWCNGQASVRSRLNGNWFGCQTDKCWRTFNEIYVDSTNRLSLDWKDGLRKWGGGVSSHSCRWGNNGASFDCGFVHMGKVEGFADISFPTGESKDRRTPLAKPFLSFRRGGFKRAIWLRGPTGWNREYHRWARTDSNARWSGAWGDSTTTLQVFRCTNTHCYWSEWGP